MLHLIILYFHKLLNFFLYTALIILMHFSPIFYNFKNFVWFKNYEQNFCIPSTLIPVCLRVRSSKFLEDSYFSGKKKSLFGKWRFARTSDFVAKNTKFFGFTIFLWCCFHVYNPVFVFLGIYLVLSNQKMSYS